MEYVPDAGRDDTDHNRSDNYGGQFKHLAAKILVGTVRYVTTAHNCC